jgi:hypothetical protein
MYIQLSLRERKRERESRKKEMYEMKKKGEEGNKIN